MTSEKTEMITPRTAGALKMVIIAGARPNFMKIAPLIRAIEKHNGVPGNRPVEYIFVHTGQHYDYQMSNVFFEDLGLPEPDSYLAVGSGTHVQQTARVMLRLEKLLKKEKPDLVLVVGDVNSTMAGALAAVKMQIHVAHVEAGLRSYDRTMPEEINRLVTDSVSDYLFTPSPDAGVNLRKEGIPENKIFQVGNVMADSLLANKAKAENSRILDRLGLKKNGFALLTLHRPGNVDDRNVLAGIIGIVRQISEKIPVVFPVHPRTRENIEKFILTCPDDGGAITFIDPAGYLDFIKLMMNARFVMSDSGGVQEETTLLGVPCLTLRHNTERQITVTEGTNILVKNDREMILGEVTKILNDGGKRGAVPCLWDGKAAERVITILSQQDGKA